MREDLGLALLINMKILDILFISYMPSRSSALVGGVLAFVFPRKTDRGLDLGIKTS